MSDFFEYWSTIDWVVTAKATRDFSVSVATLIGATVAVLGLKAWRKQLRGKTEYDLSRRLLKAALKIREGIRRVRSPVMMTGEINEAVEKRHPGMPVREVSQIDSNAAVYGERWGSINQALVELNLELIEAEVIWGSDAKEKCEPLRDCIVELKIAVRKSLQLQSDRPPPLDPEEVTQNDHIVYEISEDPEKDPFTKRVNDALDEIRALVAPHLQL